MRAYGHVRKDKLECGYGCCSFKGGKAMRCRAVVDKGRRKRARRVKEVDANPDGGFGVLTDFYMKGI